jgi:hypothetical protein
MYLWLVEVLRKGILYCKHIYMNQYIHIHIRNPFVRFTRSTSLCDSPNRHGEVGPTNRNEMLSVAREADERDVCRMGSGCAWRCSPGSAWAAEQVDLWGRRAYAQ